MLAVLQRVSEARVLIDGQVSGEIGAGLLVLLCAERGDTALQNDKLLAKLLHLPLFRDSPGQIDPTLPALAGPGTGGPGGPSRRGPVERGCGRRSTS